MDIVSKKKLWHIISYVIIYYHIYILNHITFFIEAMNSNADENERLNNSNNNRPGFTAFGGSGTVVGS